MKIFMHELVLDISSVLDLKKKKHGLIAEPKAANVKVLEVFGREEDLFVVCTGSRIWGFFSTANM